MKLKDHALGVRKSEHDIKNCETCQLNRSKKLPVPENFGTRAKDVLKTVHTDV